MDSPQQKHTHGTDCCWACFDGKPIHPLRSDDPACGYRSGEDGRCTYALRRKTP